MELNTILYRYDAVMLTGSKDLDRMVVCFDNLFKERMLKVATIKRNILVLKEMEFHHAI